MWRLLALARLPGWASRAAHLGSASLGKTLRLIAQHTGIPLVLVAAIGLVISWRIARRATRLAFELALALMVVVAASKLGWVRW